MKKIFKIQLLLILIIFSSCQKDDIQDKEDNLQDIKISLSSIPENQTIYTWYTNSENEVISMNEVKNMASNSFEIKELIGYKEKVSFHFLYIKNEKFYLKSLNNISIGGIEYNRILADTEEIGEAKLEYNNFPSDYGFLSSKRRRIEGYFPSAIAIANDDKIYIKVKSNYQVFTDIEKDKTNILNFTNNSSKFDSYNIGISNGIFKEYSSVTGYSDEKYQSYGITLDEINSDDNFLNNYYFTLPADDSFFKKYKLVLFMDNNEENYFSNIYFGIIPEKTEIMDAKISFKEIEGEKICFNTEGEYNEFYLLLFNGTSQWVAFNDTGEMLFPTIPQEILIKYPNISFETFTKGSIYSAKIYNDNETSTYDDFIELLLNRKGQSLIGNDKIVKGTVLRGILESVNGKKDNLVETEHIYSNFDEYGIN